MKVVNPEKATDKDVWPMPAHSFAGVEDNYFLEALVPKGPTTGRVVTFALPQTEGKPTLELATVVSGQGVLEASRLLRTQGRRDPRELRPRARADRRLRLVRSPRASAAVADAQAHGLVGNWGLAILVVTFLIRVLLFPLTAKSYVSMKKMQKLAPKINAIRDKYKKAKSDPAQRQKMNTEMMALYQSEGANPMSGCLPMILQLPILVAFYNVPRNAIELRHAPFVLWIKDLSAIDATYVLVILMIVSMYVQQAMTPSTMDPAQKKIFMLMPLFMGFVFKDMPAGLVLYWLFSNLLTIVQQIVMNRIVKEDDPAPPARGAKALKQARA